MFRCLRSRCVGCLADSLSFPSSFIIRRTWAQTAPGEFPSRLAVPAFTGCALSEPGWYLLDHKIAPHMQSDVPSSESQFRHLCTLTVRSDNAGDCSWSGTSSRSPHTQCAGRSLPRREVGQPRRFCWGGATLGCQRHRTWLPVCGRRNEILGAFMSPLATSSSPAGLT